MWRSRLTGIGWGFAGVLLALFAYHLWLDHVNLHAAITFLNQYGERLQKLPAP